MGSFVLEEKVPLLPLQNGDLQQEVKVKPLGYFEVPRAVKGAYAATRVGSEEQYFEDVDDHRLAEPREKLALTLALASAVRARRILTVDHGDAILEFVEPGQERSLLPGVQLIMPLLKKMQPAEVTERKKELVAAIVAVFNETIGDRAKDMFELAALATAPHKQGRGYATALVTTLNSMADARGKAIWLVTVDTAGFYEMHGYRVAGKKWIAKNNPKWEGGPIPVIIMVREPQGYAEKGDLMV